MDKISRTAHRFRGFSKVFFYVFAAIYPVFVFYFLVIRKTPIRTLSLFVIAFALFAFIAVTSQKKSETTRGSGRKPLSMFWNSLLLFGLGLVCLLTNSGIILKLYPLLINLLFLGAFGITLLRPPSMIFRFAIFYDKSIPGSLVEKRIAAYCVNVTIVWIAFFIINGSIAAFTIFSGSDAFWAFYNGGISYILIGILFAVELLIRKKVQKNMPKAVPLSALNNKSRDPSAIVCYEGAWSDAVYKTYGDFIIGIAALRRHIFMYLLPY